MVGVRLGVARFLDDDQEIEIKDHTDFKSVREIFTQSETIEQIRIHHKEAPGHRREYPQGP